MPTYIPRATPLAQNRAINGQYTVKMVYEGMLWELNKVSAPSMDVEDFNYWWPVAVGNYYKKRYTLYDVNQQLSDDLRELSATFLYTPASTPALDQTNETFPLPPQYWHALGVTVFWQVLVPFKTYRLAETVNFQAERIAIDKLVSIRRDHYNMPSYKKVYFVERGSYVEIHAGIHGNLRLKQVEFSYLLQWEKTELRMVDLDDPTTDPSAPINISVPVVEEILKELVHLVLENQGNPRLQTKIPIDAAVPSGPPPIAQPQQPRR